MNTFQWEMADVRQRTEKKTDRKTSENAKTPEKKLVQLNLHNVPKTRSSTLSEKASAKNDQKRTDSSVLKSPSEARPDVLDFSMELKQIQESLSEIKNNMVCKSEIKDIVSSILNELKVEIIAEVKATVLNEIKTNTAKEIKEDVKKEFEQELEKNTKEYRNQVKEISDGVNLDIETLREKFCEQAREMRGMKENLKSLQIRTDSALRLANQNQQYSQKCNIKFLKWEEKQNENLREDLCKILHESVSIELAPADILAIHRIPGRARDGPRPVIAKFRDPETKVRIIKKRSQENLKKHFVMYDHITAMNSKLIRDLNEDSKIHSAWYFNGKVFGIDSNGNRHRFDILDDINEKLRQRR